MDRLMLWRGGRIQHHYCIRSYILSRVVDGTDRKLCGAAGCKCGDVLPELCSTRVERSGPDHVFFWVGGLVGLRDLTKAGWS